MTKKIIRAGVIPYHVRDDGEVEMMFMKPADPTRGGDEFQIAKGKLEDGEDPEEAAFREATEELGLLPGNVVKRRNAGTYLTRTHMYYAKIKDKDLFGMPQQDETGETGWLTHEEFMDSGRSLHKTVVEDIYKKIKKDERGD